MGFRFKNVISKKLSHVKKLTGRGIFYREIGLNFFRARLSRSSELFMKARRRRLRVRKLNKRSFFFEDGNRYRLLLKRDYSSYLRGRKNLCSVSLVSLCHYKITRDLLEGIRLCLRRVLSKRVVVFRRVFPWLSVHMKPLQVRMGKGKGSKFKTSLCFIKPGDIIFDLVGFRFVDFSKLEEVLMSYLPFRAKFLFLEKL